MITSYFKVSFASLSRNRLRTTLSVLGISIGIAAVIATAALGTAGSERVRAQMAALGNDFLWVRAGNSTVGGARSGIGGAHTLTASDGVALASIRSIEDCSPLFSARQQIVSGGRNWNTRYQAVLPAYFDIRHRSLIAGSLFTDYDVTTDARVIVLGAD